jgi:ribose transport system permease protein
MLATAPGAAYLLVTLSVVFGLTAHGFATPGNLVNVVLRAAVLTILALGMTLVMLTEGVDLSMGPVVGLAGVSAGLVLVGGSSLALAIVVALAIGVVFGVLNGVLVACVGLPAFVVTLGTFGMAQSLAMVLTEGNSVTGLPPVVRWFKVFGLANRVTVMKGGRTVGTRVTSAATHEDVLRMIMTGVAEVTTSGG